MQLLCGLEERCNKNTLTGLMERQVYWHLRMKAWVISTIGQSLSPSLNLSHTLWKPFLLTPWQCDESESWNQNTVLFYCLCHMRQILPKCSSISRWDLRNLFNDHKLEASYCDSQHSATWKDVKVAVQGRPIQSVAGDKDTFGTLTGMLKWFAFWSKI